MSGDKYKCHACPRRAAKIGEAEIAQGWGRFQGRIGIGRQKVTITLVHCPIHLKGFYVVIGKKLRVMSKTVSARRTRAV